MSVSIVIPAYNESDRLRPFLDEIVTHQQSQPNAVQEIIVVDDGSTDNTAEVANSYAQKLHGLTVYSLAVNQGKGAAVQAGVLKAQSDHIVFMDADGATPISELPKMVAALQKADIAVGNRWMPGAHTERHSLLRQFSGWVYRTYMSIFGLGSIDTMCGFKGYRRVVGHDLFTGLIEKRWLFDTEVAYKAVKRGYKTKNFPISWTSKDGSKLDTATLLRSALAIWPLINKIDAQERSRKSK